MNSKIPPIKIIYIFKMGRNKAWAKARQELTVNGLGSRILLINFFALEENHGGQLKSALNICNHIENFFRESILNVEDTNKFKCKLIDQ